jgi:DNA-binding helix-hairpin-helix protein with protein kinase domain
MTTVLPKGTETRLQNWAMTGVLTGRRFGGGGQGAVWELEVPDAKMFLALKWYFQRSATPGQARSLQELIDHGAPRVAGRADDRYVWPLDLARIAGSELFGYVMRVVSPEYVSMLSCVKKEVDIPFSVRLRAGRELADAFCNLHSEGYCYRDVSFGNLFLHPTTGAIQILDNDNVGKNGTPTSVAGTPGFMAPEVVRMEAYPSIQTDWHSLAVLLFYLLVRADPFLGRAELAFPNLDTQAQQQLWGFHPVFIFDPDDSSNAPVPDVHGNALANWPLLPGSVRELFTQAFTVGIRDPQQRRVPDWLWRSELASLLNDVYPCPKCGAENFDDPAEVAEQAGRCWHCGRHLRRPPRLQTSKDQVALYPAAVLYPHHLRTVHNHKAFDYSAPVADVQPHPEKRDVLGLRNLTDVPWTGANAEGREITVPPGRSVRIAPGVRVRIGDTEAVVVPPGGTANPMETQVEAGRR